MSIKSITIASAVLLVAILLLAGWGAYIDERCVGYGYDGAALVDSSWHCYEEDVEYSSYATVKTGKQIGREKGRGMAYE